jgi:regulatory protein SWI6
MEINNLVVMRRRDDSWLNATQILKIAGIEKGKRTKVLEKEILAGQHEKVQGGYGKYQGTWINYRRGVEFCRQYGVEEILRPLLEYDMGQDGLTLAGHGRVETPTKEQAMAAQRKRNMLNGGIENRPPTNSSNGTFFENISKTAVHAVTAIHKARLDSPGPRPASGNRRPISAQRPSQSLMGSQESTYQGSSQQTMSALDAENSFGPHGQLDPILRGPSAPYLSTSHDLGHNGEIQEPPRKRMRPLSSQEGSAFSVSGRYELSMGAMPPTGTSQALAYQEQDDFKYSVDLNLTGLPPLPQPTTNSALEKQKMLTSLFLDPSQTDFSKHPALVQLSGEDLDIPIDATAHTALHWAATLARTSLLRALILKGANTFRLNGGGETALIRAALTTNNLDQGSFPELLELLGPTIEIRDGRGRTVLHHIAVSSAVKGRSPACRYYLESLLEFVVRQGSASNSTQNSFLGSEQAATPSKSIGLVRFMSEMVNVADMAGDTALNLASRIGNKSIIHQLLEVGADPNIPNRAGLKPADFGVGDDAKSTGVQQLEPSSRVEGDPMSKVMESSQELLNCKTPGSNLEPLKR